MTAVLPLPSGGALVFDRPSAKLVAHEVADVMPVLREVDAWLARGGWVAGYLSYEAAPAFDPALVTAAKPRGAAPEGDGRLPLACFGLFRACRREALADSLPGFETATTGSAAPLAWTPSIEASTHAAQVAAVRDAI